MNEEEKAEFMAKLVLWMVECPVKLETDTINAIVNDIHIQVLRQKLKKAMELT